MSSIITTSHCSVLKSLNMVRALNSTPCMNIGWFAPPISSSNSTDPHAYIRSVSFAVLYINAHPNGGDTPIF